MGSFHPSFWLESTLSRRNSNIMKNPSPCPVINFFQLIWDAIPINKMTGPAKFHLDDKGYSVILDGFIRQIMWKPRFKASVHILIFP